MFNTNNIVMSNWNSTRKYYVMYKIMIETANMAWCVKFCKFGSAVNITRSSNVFELVNTAWYVKFCKWRSVSRYYWSKFRIESLKTVGCVKMCKWSSVAKGHVILYLNRSCKQSVVSLGTSDTVNRPVWRKATDKH